MAWVERWRIHGKALLRKILLPQEAFSLPVEAV